MILRLKDTDQKINGFPVEYENLMVFGRPGGLPWAFLGGNVPTLLLVFLLHSRDF